MATRPEKLAAVPDGALIQSQLPSFPLEWTARPMQERTTEKVVVEFEDLHDEYDGGG
jgi:hypothetical protein